MTRFDYWKDMIEEAETEDEVTKYMSKAEDEIETDEEWFELQDIADAKNREIWRYEEETEYEEPYYYCPRQAEMWRGII